MLTEVNNFTFYSCICIEGLFQSVQFLWNTVFIAIGCQPATQTNKQAQRASPPHEGQEQQTPNLDFTYVSFRGQKLPYRWLFFFTF